MATFEEVKEKAIAGNVKAQIALGEYHLNNEEYHFAKHWFIQASENDARGLLGLATTYEMMKDPAEAVKVYQQMYEKYQDKKALDMIILHEETAKQYLNALTWLMKGGIKDYSDEHKATKLSFMSVWDSGSYNEQKFVSVLILLGLTSIMGLFEFKEMDEQEFYQLLADLIGNVYGIKDKNKAPEYISDHIIKNNHMPVYGYYLKGEMGDYTRMMIKLIN
jgi:tetratricopeptide (TPR) repeat protein